ncbi:monovalent cation:proton antiporter-2 (CPA2) family protein [Aestuariirhabdus sp. Z084]|uniref:monovalent cation:proton antiporter-2 (CPA2) family protein n=1 Tax=Aestuariirhabdus haliotis TaxID=2918751 RepID=UPI00201B44A4|nr:monovalent cation:proton antiporter-2 (CPA2) family protein [Aestuariirhabdus haliotis]MCL6417127.1 monovalent cation:proton antiporter-2 (CPA2) family protein [Aestuariirhabdus haliotis]MCL6421077.1 monovalent cation:proton antiporter-2 (CPA2) family protein [Aestuariirhabdus haliotis]
MTGYFIQAFIYLCAAVIAVPIAKRLGLGSVLGYLIAGVVIGPLTGLVGSETVTIQHFAEFGVVMMLFLVGLELDPRMLWGMRNKLIGLGGLQVTLSSLLIMAVCIMLGLSCSVSLAIGMVLSLSSTAIVLQTFQEKGLAKTEGGKSAFSVLLFQDIAVIPMLAFIPLLAMSELGGVGNAAVDDHQGTNDLVSHLPGWLYGLVVLGSIAVVIVGGHFLSRPLFRFIADTGLREMFTATALMLVIGISALMSLVGLSPALGTFLAGVVLANSEFRHELETDIEPFKGILLGLFFITVGASINFDLVASNAGIIFFAVFAIMIVKGLVLFLLARLFKVRRNDGWLLTLSLAQAGEFGFVLLSFTVQNNVIPQDVANILSPVVAITMFLTPILFIVFDKLVLKFYQAEEAEQPAEAIDEQGSVIIAGIGRFGQIVNRLLVANEIPTVVLDHSATVIDRVSRVNIKSWYGDASRPDLLHTAGIEDAKLLVVAIDDPVRALDMVRHVKEFHPHVSILARAFDRGHGYDLTHAGADIVVSETYYSALELGGEALKVLDVHPFKVEQMKAAYNKVEQESRQEICQEWHEGEADNRFTKSYLDLFLEIEKRLVSAIKRNRQDGHDTSGSGWTPPPKHYLDDFE